MKRDMDLARNILIELEEGEEAIGPFQLEQSDVSGEKLGYHVLLLAEAGLIEAEDHRALSRDWDWRPLRLTWEGHEFLEEIRDEGIWKRAVALVKNKTGGVAFELLKESVKIVAKDALSGGRPPC